MGIPLITERRHLKGTPTVCEDCKRFGIEYCDAPLPGYRYCQICIEGFLLDNEPNWNELRTIPTYDPITRPLMSGGEYFIAGGIRAWVVHRDVDLTSVVRLQNKNKVSMEVRVTDHDIRRGYGKLEDIPDVARAVDSLRQMQHKMQRWERYQSSAEINRGP